MRTVRSVSTSAYTAPEVAVDELPISEIPAKRRELNALNDELMLAMEMVSSGQTRVTRL